MCSHILMICLQQNHALIVAVKINERTRVHDSIASRLLSQLYSYCICNHILIINLWQNHELFHNVKIKPLVTMVFLQRQLNTEILNKQIFSKYSRGGQIRCNSMGFISDRTCR